MSKDREHKVKIEKFHRPATLGFITRIDKVLNLSAIAREIKSCNSKQLFVARLNRHTDLTKTDEKKAFAEEVGELFNELWYIVGVGLGKFPRDPHKKFRFFYRDDAERLKDTLEEIEARIQAEKKQAEKEHLKKLEGSDEETD